ncbi:MAG TPA: hypothetical protein VHS53_18530, partial [Mucilaginibacter sp.]|nr:hypothetical protein [Mucilaginibacter sp.]
MKKNSFILSVLVNISTLAFAGNVDTLHVQPADLNLKAIQTGDYRYVCYFQKTKESPATRIFLV